jgi:purine-binding chemotaxis protein CheW
MGTDGYGISVMHVREIIRICPITPVPRMPSYVKGVINLRGTVIAVVDLREKFQMPEAVVGDRNCIIVVQVQLGKGSRTLMGAIVDSVEEVINLSAADIEPTPDFGETLSPNYMLGVSIIRGSVKTLLDIERIFQEDGQLALPTVSKSAPTTASSVEA